MPSVVPTLSQQSSPPLNNTAKKSFATVLGLGSAFRYNSDTDSDSQPAIDQTQTQTQALHRNHVSPPQSINTTETYTTTSARKSGAGRFSVTNLSFERVPRSAKHTPSNSIPATAQAPDSTFDTMKALDTNLPTSSRRGPVRMDNQDGPWSVSVAETPYDTRAYCLYIKTPTHNLTLTRTAMELVELDLKLRQSHSNVKIPTLPINPDSLPVPPKRKSNFLNTLSRLASPTSAKSNRQSSTSRRGTTASTTTLPSASPTPRIPPSAEANDPFGSFTSSNGNVEEAESAPVVTSSATSTAIAAYLTTVSNTPALRMDRVWKRFVRVRTDDLESQRADKPIKRVQSDLAAHLGSLGKEKDGMMLKENHRSNNLPSHHVHTGAPAGAHGGSAVTSDEKDSLIEETMTVDFEGHVPKDAAVPGFTTVKEDFTAENQSPKEFVEASPPSDAPPDSTVPATHLPPESNEFLPAPLSISSQDGTDASDEGGENGLPSTPVTSTSASEPHRMHRSQSAEPDKSHRVPRGYASSVQSQTGDESSSSAALYQNGHGRRRKKRSASSIPKEPKKSQRKVVIDDFEMMRVLGKGCAGKVLLVRHKTTSDLFALKAITKRHVLAHQELQHTLTEQAVLKRMAAESRDPFVVKLWWSFHDKENLFLVMDFHPGGDLATQLARWGRLGRDRARFYAAEIVEGVEGLHAAGVIYRDLKPENILIGADGHIVLTDFGLSKEFPRRSSTAPIRAAGEFYSSVPGTPQQPTSPPWMSPDRSGELSLGWPGQPIGHTDSTTTFCGTAEYLAPEVIQGLAYSYEVDWWSFGTMLYEMLTGITPFWAGDHSDMYVRVLQDELQFPDDRAIDQDTKSLIRGLLQRVPTLRICEPRIKKHPYFSMIDWSHVYYKRYIPPYIPPIDPSNASDTQNFDETFLDMEPVLDDYDESEAMETDQEPQTDTDRTDGEDSNTTPSQSRSSSIRPQPQMAMEDGIDVFDGYSFKGRHSVLIDDGDEEEESEEGSDEEESIAETDNISSLLGSLEQQAAEIDGKSQLLDDTVQEGIVEPKTPEARPAALPLVVDIPVTPAQPPVIEEIVEAVRQPVKDDEPVPSEASKEDDTRPKETNGGITPPPPPPNTSKPLPARQLVTNRGGRPRREKSGVPALDRYLSDAIDEDTEATEAERDEDDDWDFIEAADGEDRNGTKGTSLFARGVVDRYRLAVFRKASTPSSRPTAPRSASGMSAASSVTDATEYASPPQRRGRQGLTFRKHPRQFLRPKSPPSSFSAKSSITARSISHSVSASNTLSAASSTGMLTPSLSVGSTFAMSPSLKSKESATSVGARSQSSDQSGRDTSAVFVDAPDTKASQSAEPEKGKTKKLKRYKNNAEKVFSLFSSPRQQTS